MEFGGRLVFEGCVSGLKQREMVCIFSIGITQPQRDSFPFLVS